MTRTYWGYFWRQRNLQGHKYLSNYSDESGPIPPPPPPTLVLEFEQRTGVAVAAGFSYTFATVHVGDLVLCSVSVAGVLTTVATPAGWTLVASQAAGLRGTLYLFAMFNAPSPLNVTFTFSGLAFYMANFAEWSDSAMTIGPTDQTSSQTGIVSTWDTGPTALTVWPQELAVAVVANVDGNAFAGTSPAGWTLVNSPGPMNMFWLQLTSTQIVQASASDAAAAFDWAAIVGTFRAA